MASELNRAIAHSINYHSLENKLGMADWQAADLIEPEVKKWLDGVTDVQLVEKDKNNG